jgi:mannose-1-phosphate guanylyltransferase
MLTNQYDEGGITILQLVSHRLTASALPHLMQARDQMVGRGRHAMLVDLSKTRSLTNAGLGALIEFSADFGTGRTLAFCNALPSVVDRIQGSGATALISYYTSKSDALRDKRFQSQRLAGSKALILCAGTGSRMAPLTDASPKPMLDLFGAPLISHLIRHLSQFGLNDILLNPGYKGDQIDDIRTSHPAQRLHFFAEGHDDGEGWHGAPVGSASTLAQLQQRHRVFDTDSFVLCGDALIDIDLADMMQAHRECGAAVTIATATVPLADTSKYGILRTNRTGRVLAFQEKPQPDHALSTLANTGIYIFHPRVLTNLPCHDGQDIATHLLPAILARGGHIQSYTKPFEWVDMGCPRDYVRAHFNAIRGHLKTLCPADQIHHCAALSPSSSGKTIWLASDAKVSRRAALNGPCYIGPGTSIAPGVTINGPCVIGAGCRVEAGCLISDSLLLPNTWVRSGAWIDGQLAGPDWAIPYTNADGGFTNFAKVPLDRTGPLPENERKVSLPQIAGSSA